MPERVCETCTNQVMWGCDAEETDEPNPSGPGNLWKRPAAIPLTLDDKLFYGCPRRPLKDDPLYWQRLLFHWGHYSKGYLPDEGGLASQSFRALTLFGIIDDAMAECERDKAEAAQAKAARGKRV